MMRNFASIVGAKDMSTARHRVELISRQTLVPSFSVLELAFDKALLLDFRWEGSKEFICRLCTLCIHVILMSVTVERS